MIENGIIEFLQVHYLLQFSQKPIMLRYLFPCLVLLFSISSHAQTDTTKVEQYAILSAQQKAFNS